MAYHQPLVSSRRSPPTETAYDHLGCVEYATHTCQPLWPEEVEPEMKGFAKVVHHHLGELQRSVEAYPRCHVELSFPKWLNSYERYLIHRFTDCYKLLRHHSSDGAQGRRLYVFGGQNVEYADRIARFKLADKQLHKVASYSRSHNPRYTGTGGGGCQYQSDEAANQSLSSPDPAQYAQPVWAEEEDGRAGEAAKRRGKFRRPH